MHRLPRIKVEQIMTKKVVTVNEDDSLEELAEKFREHNFHGFPVIDKEGKLTGIVTEKDFLKIFRSEHLQSLFASQIKDIMVSPVVTITPEYSLGEVLDVMFEHALRLLPVFHEEKLVGIITQRDIVTRLLAPEPEEKPQSSIFASLAKKMPFRKK
ncbi:MAG TPA: CBS domain-containing protein [Actinobacteria bacterium]|nr:CBS domain-containing protein [Actinomycetota bacterium]